MAIAILSAFYTREQAKISKLQFEQETLVRRHRSLAVVISAIERLERELSECLTTAANVEGCGPALAKAEVDVRLAARDPEVATYYPLLHSDLESINFDVGGRYVASAIQSIVTIQPHIDEAVRELDHLDMLPGLLLSQGVHDLQMDAVVVSRFGTPADAGISATTSDARVRTPDLGSEN